MRTQICDMLGIEFPIFAFSHCRDVVAAVSKAGGLGVFGVGASVPEKVEMDLAWTRDQLGDRPFGVDIVVPAKYEGRDSGGLTKTALESRIPQEHRDFVEDLLERYGVPPLPEDTRQPGEGPVQRSVLSHKQARAVMDVAFSYGPALMANALGTPPADLIDEAHSRGVLVAALAGSSKHAASHVAAGVDVIVAQGTEAGGHSGEISTMVLVPEIVDAVAPVPVLAAGGIGRGRQVAASLALGAAGAWCGSVWLTTEEAETQPTVKEKLLAAASGDTVRSRSRTGKPARQLRSAWTEAWEAPGAPSPLPMPLQAILAGPAHHRIARAAHNPNSRAAELSNYYVGQIVGSMSSVQPAGRVVLEMVEECIESIQRLEALMNLSLA